MLELMYLDLKDKVKLFLKNKKGSDDKNTGSAMAMIFAVVIGSLLITAMFGFFNRDFLPVIFSKLLNILNYNGG